MNKKIIIVFIFAFSFVVTLIYTNFREKSFTILQNVYTRENLQLKEGELIKGDKISGQFISQEDNLGIVAIRFQTYDRISSDLFIFRLKEVDSNNWYYENEYEATKFGGYALFPFGFPIISASKGKDYYFELESLQGKAGGGVGIKLEEPIMEVTHKFTTRQLLSDKKMLLLFINKKISNLFTNKQSLQDFVIIAIILTTIFIFLNQSKNLFNYSYNLTINVKRKAHFPKEKLNYAGRFMRSVLNFLGITGEITIKILSLFPKWLRQE